MVGIVLTGGASRRFGRDKALATVGGRPMARRVADAMVAAGLEGVVAVGGDRAALERLGLGWVADRWPGDGPLGGLRSGLEALHDAAFARGDAPPAALVCACDLPDLTADALGLVLAAARPHADAVVPVVAGRRQPLAALYRPAARRLLGDAWEAGERSVLGALRSLTVVEVAVPAARAAPFHDRDTAV